MDKIRSLAFVALVFLMAGCVNGEPEGNPVQTAMSQTLEARPPATATSQVTPTVAPDAAPSGKIAYVCQYSKRVSKNQICLINADGSDQRVLTVGGDYDDFFPSITPDGNAVLFTSSRSGRYQLYEYDLTTDLQTQLTFFTDFSAFAPTASPDGSYIVFYTIADGRSTPVNHSVWVMERDGSNPTQITHLPGGGWDPVWSPDGTQIQFAAQVGDLVQLFHVNVDGSDLAQITHFSGIRGRNDWSRDGLNLATYRGSTWNWEIYIFDPNGENVRQLTFDADSLAPSFSPDSKWIVFMSYRDHPHAALGCEIYIMRIDGSDVRRLTDNDICDWQPRWGN